MNTNNERLDKLKNKILNLKHAYIIVGGKQQKIYGYLNMTKMFVWTSKENAQEFIEKNLNADDDKILEYKLEETINLARDRGFSGVIFDFIAKDCPPITNS